MSETPNLGLPYIVANQAQKHVPHNDALALIDGLLQLSLVARGLNAPPASPADGQRWLVGPSPGGDWSGQAGRVALRNAGAWDFLTPRKGWAAWIEAEAALLVFDGSAWVAPPAPSVLQNLSLMGVNATADATNRLAVSSPAVLLNHAGAGLQLKLNKNTPADTASLLMQTGFSGRAELGVVGDDHFHLKVSADGGSWKEALLVDAGTGLARVLGNPADPLGVATKQYADAQLSAAQQYADSQGSAAKQYADGLAVSTRAYADAQGAAARQYADGLVSAIPTPTASASGPGLGLVMARSLINI